MAVNKKSLGMTLGASLLVSLCFAQSAHAYGPEGMFGGRANPDSTIALQNTVQVETQPERAESVLGHPRPDYDPVPLEFGSFQFFPSLEAGASYDSNIFATTSKPVADEISTVHPALNAVSNWNRNALAITTFGDLNYYADNSSENFNNAVVAAQGRYDIANQTWLAARGGYQYLSEPRSSPNVAGSTKEPVTFNTYQAGVTAYRGAGLLQAQIDYDLKRLDYNNAAGVTGGIINESVRNRDEHVVGGKATYEVTKNFMPYVKTTYNIRDYDNNTTRQSNGYDAVVGSTFDFGGITSLDAYIGYMAQDYANFSAASNVNSGAKFGGHFLWNITNLTSLALETNRTIEETTLTTFNSYTATGGSATLTHELLRNVLLEGNYAFTRDDFVGVGSRQDDEMVVGVGTRWLINRYLYSNLLYNWDNRASSAAGEDFTKNIITLRVGVQM